MSTTGEAVQVEQWRCEQVLRLGYSADLARWIALQPEIDIHELARLIARGAALQLAYKILAP